jgi:ammonia channel protein AmtB
MKNFKNKIKHEESIYAILFVIVLITVSAITCNLWFNAESSLTTIQLSIKIFFSVVSLALIYCLREVWLSTKEVWFPHKERR